MHAGLKAVVERVLCASGAPRVARLRRAGSALVLAYHDIVPGDVATSRIPANGTASGFRGDASLHLPQASFARQLDLLVREYDVVPLASVLEAPRGNRPRAAITFDDAYHGALTAGVDELEKRGLPATVFVAPAFVGGGGFWWDALAGEDGPADCVRAHALDALGGRDRAVREWAAAAGTRARALPPHMTVASETTLARATARGMTLASHTWSHPALPALPPDELKMELERPLAWLRERFQGVLPWISYPYGLTSPAVARAAAAAGYRAALRVDGGWMGSAAEPYDLPRLNVPAGASIRGFELRTAGLLR